MNKNLNDYIKIYRNHLPADVCDTSVEYLNLCNFTVHKFYNNAGEYSSHLNASAVCFDMIPSNEVLMKYTWDAINQYVNQIGFPWFKSWAGFTRPKFNKYDPNTRMDNHCDHIKDMFDGERKGVPILTVLCGLNDTYTGGNLMMFDGEDYSLNKGDVIIFPSNFLYPHTITPVITGTRYSAVSWVW